MAYAVLAGLRPIYGLYAGLAALVIYPILSTSPAVAMGPASLQAILTAEAAVSLGLEPQDDGDEYNSARYAAVAARLAILVGFVQVALGLLRFGQIVKFLSKPVLKGFHFGVAVTTASSQLARVLGLSGLPRRSVAVQVWYQVGLRLGDTHAASAALSVCCFLAFLVVSWTKTYLASLPQVKHDRSRFWKRAVGIIPAPLVVVALSTVAVYTMGLQDRGVRIVGEVPSGLPVLENPFSNAETNRAARAENVSDGDVPSVGEDLQQLIGPAAVAAGLGILELVSVGKGAENLYDMPLDVTQEMVGVGAGNIAASAVGGFPITGSFSRSSVNADAGARTPMSSWITAAFLSVTLVYLTELFFFLPQVALGVMIIYAVLKQFDSEIPRMLWAVDKRDCAVFFATLLATVGLGVQNGLAVGAVLSLGRLLQESAAPRVSRLGRAPGTKSWINFGRHYRRAKEEPGVAVLRFESHLYFANALHFRDEVMRASFPWRQRGNYEPLTPADYEATPPPPAVPTVPGMGPALPPEAVIVDCSAITRVDASAVDVLENIPREVKRNAKRLREQRVQRLRRALEQMEDDEAKQRAVAGGHDRLCVCETTTNNAGEEFLTCRLECSCILKTFRGCLLGF